MSANAGQDKTRDSLAKAIATDRLPTDMREHAGRLLSRLDTPIRVSLMGLPGSGKSSVMTLLLGRQLIPEGIKMPTTEVHGAEVTQAHLTLPDGSTKTLPGVDAAEIASYDPIFVKIELPLPALNKISVMELVTTDDRIEMIRGMKWAAKRTDIAIWATQSYAGPEHVLWREMPDTVKDHAILIRTKADQLGGMAEREDAADDLSRMAGEHFAQVMPLATLEAVSARKSDGTVNKDLLRSSGGVGLISTIMRQIDLGRQSTIDQAAILLHKNGLTDILDEGAEETPAPEPESAAKPDVPAAPEEAAPAEPETSFSKVVSRVLSRPIATKDLPKTVSKVIVPRPAPKIAAQGAAQPAPQTDTATDQARLPQSVRDLFDKTAADLGALGQTLMDDADLTANVVIKTAETALNSLGTALDDVPEPDLPQVNRLRDATLDAQDMVQLMKLEQDANAAMDAASLLVQIRRQLLLDLAQ